MALANTFHKLSREQIRPVEKPYFSPQIIPLYPLASGPNRAQTGVPKTPKSKDLGTRISLSPQTLFDYNTKTNSYFLSN